MAAKSPRATTPSTRSALATFVIAKLLVLWFGVQAFMVLQNISTPTPRQWLEIWNRWDAPHYLDILSEGYEATGERRRWIVFFPLFPWLGRLVNFLVRDPLGSAFLVATVASIVAAYLLYRLASLDEEKAVAHDAVFFLAVFPTAYFLHIGYTEGLFLALSLGSFYAARQRRWATAGVIGALAALSRINGILLIPALAVEAWDEYRRTRRFDRRWLWIFFISTGLAIYLAINKTVAGSWFAFRTHQRENWNRELAMPWDSIHDAWLSVWSRPPATSIMVGWQELLFTMVAIVLAVWCWMKTRPSYAAWTSLNVLLWTSTGFLLSAPRYALTLFPMYVCFARITQERPALRAAITLWSLLFLGFFSALFVSGKWAF